MARYVLGGLLGRGGMAEVFAGYVNGDHGFQKPVAIKRLLPALAADRGLVDRLIAEAKLVVGMQHGNIVSVLDLARDDRNVFFVMEYVDGPSLRQLLQARGAQRLSFGVVTYIIQSAAAGLEFAHARPGGAIIHSDVSPSNLLLTTSGEVRVADFGIARREGKSDGIIEGKWAYMAPEQARGEPLSRSSDVFALGVVLYELLTGQHPLGPGRGRIAPPRTLNPRVPPGLDAICMRAVAELPRDRYARMQHLIDALINERFANQWREGANELAGAIREIGGGARQAPAAAPPIRLMTRSLIVPSVGAGPVQPAAPPSRPKIGPARPHPLGRQARGSSPQPHVVANTPMWWADGRSVSVSGEIAGDAPPRPPAPVPLADHGLDGRARWSGAKRNPKRVVAALLPTPELTTIHGARASTHDRRPGARALPLRGPALLLTLSSSVLLGTIVFIALRSFGDRGSRIDAGSPAALATAMRLAVPPSPPPAASSPPVVNPAAPASPAIAEPAAPAAPANPPPPSPAATAIAEPAAPVAPANPPPPSPAATAIAEPAPAASPAATAPRAKIASPARDKPADAMLRVNTINSDSAWAFAYLDGERQEVPGAKFKAAPGRHVVKLENPKLDLELSCTVTLVPQRTVSLNVDLESGECRVAPAR